jgi:glycosyltransferase involved in cell wall biosynthesis
MTIKIGIDLSVTRTNQAGTAVYAGSLAEMLRRIDTEHEYHVFADERSRQMGQRKTLRSRTEVVYHDLIWNHVILPGKVRRAGIDLLHMPANIMPVFSPCPTVVSIQDTLPVTAPQHFTFWWSHYARIFMPLSARRAALILTNSEASKQDIVRYFRVPPEKVIVTYLAASPRFRPVSEAEIAAVKQKYRLDSFILSVCTLEPRKNMNRLVQAFALLRRAGVDYQLIHVGAKGWLYNDSLAEVQRLGVGEAVRFLGHVPVDDLVKLYNAASVFVYPSLYEGFGIPLLEAMGCGCPVVTSNGSSLPEVAGEAGILVDPHDVGQLAAAIRHVLDDPVLAAEMRQKGFTRARLFSWERCAGETLDAYRQVLGN